MGSQLQDVGSSLRHAGSFVVARGLLSLVVACGFSSCGVRAPERMGSVAVARRLSSCGSHAQ